MVFSRVLLTLDEWLECLLAHTFLPCDGKGYYGTVVGPFPNQPVFAGQAPPTNATHVWWYNALTDMDDR